MRISESTIFVIYKNPSDLYTRKGKNIGNVPRLILGNKKKNIAVWLYIVKIKLELN